MDITELRKLDEKDLQTKLADLRKEYADMRRSHTAGELPNPRVLSNARRDIARVQMVIAEAKRTKEKDNA